MRETELIRSFIKENTYLFDEQDSTKLLLQSENKLKNSFFKYVKETLQKQEYKVFFSYLKYIITINNYDKCHKLLVISNAIDALDYGDASDLIGVLIKEEFIKDIMALYVEDNTIDLTKIPGNYKTDTFMCFIDFYVDINNLEINEKSYKNKFTSSSYNSEVDEYLKQIRKIPLLTKEEEKDLAIKARQNNKSAKKKLIESNLRLVVPIAYSLCLDKSQIFDCIQEGNLALTKAVEKFDPQKGYRFSTYATSSIKNTIKQYLVNGVKNIKIPREIIKNIKKLNNTKGILRQKNGRFPSNEELAKELNWSLKKVINTQSYNLSTVSYNATIDLNNSNSEEGSELEIFLCDPNCDVEDEATSSIQKEDFLQIINNLLSKKEKNILSLRLGLYDGTPRTLEEISKMYNVSRQAINKTELNAKRKIKKHINYYKEKENEESKIDDFENKKLEFAMKNNLKKFNSNSLLRFYDKTFMYQWFNYHKNKIFSSDDTLSNMIKSQYEKYIKNKNSDEMPEFTIDKTDLLPKVLDEKQYAHYLDLYEIICAYYDKKDITQNEFKVILSKIYNISYSSSQISEITNISLKNVRQILRFYDSDLLNALSSKLNNILVKYVEKDEFEDFVKRIK